MREPSPERIRRLELALRDDIFWVVKYGPGFDPSIGADKNGVWHPTENFPGCGVCAVGAYVIRHQPKITEAQIWQCKHGRDDYLPPDVFITAKKLRVPAKWLEIVYSAVANQADLDERQAAPRGARLAKRLRSYGQKLMDRRDRLRDLAAREDQYLAEQLGWAS